ncbi:MAG: 3-hydroxyisobutyrate dehydrogenase [Betaproteobacteria bacterium]|jgi:3-hydroxyisobutyrate dehydrogenase|nr:3-hydroxyisobutyrate dehydrogenase [Betaproteobacteria bacterium]
MGSAIAQRLASLGHEMMVWNRSADKARSLGFPVAATPQALASASEIVISILTDAKAVDQVYGEMLKGDVKGKLFIEMSTVRPDVQKALSQRVFSRGAKMVECPVGGTIGPAKEGKLFGFVGGEPADVARARPVLEQMCRRVEHVGPIGSGARMKLAINLPLLVYWQALGEALSLVRDLQIEPTRLMDILADTSGAPNMLKNRAATLAAALAGKEPSPVTVNVDTMKKDLTEMVEEMRSLGWSSLVAQAALDGFTHASKAGLGAKDCSMLPVSWSAKPQKL